jgi:hypothetical protein
MARAQAWNSLKTFFHNVPVTTSIGKSEGKSTIGDFNVNGRTILRLILQK